MYIHLCTASIKGREYFFYHNNRPIDSSPPLLSIGQGAGTMEMNIGNITTIATCIAGFLLPFIGKYIGQNELTALISGIIITIWLIYNAKNPNNLEVLGNKIETPEEDIEILNDEYV